MMEEEIQQDPIEDVDEIQNQLGDRAPTQRRQPPQMQMRLQHEDEHLDDDVPNPLVELHARQEQDRDRDRVLRRPQRQRQRQWWDGFRMLNNHAEDEDEDEDGATNLDDDGPFAMMMMFHPRREHRQPQYQRQHPIGMIEFVEQENVGAEGDGEGQTTSEESDEDEEGTAYDVANPTVEEGVHVARRQAIQEIMRDTTVSALEKRLRIQHLMSGGPLELSRSSGTHPTEEMRPTIAVENGGDTTSSFVPTPPVHGGGGVVVVTQPTPTPTLLSLGTIVKDFPDFLFCLLPYIADRLIFNSIAGSNTEMYEKSKAIVPPWPTSYQLPSGDRWSWSPCGTRLACRYHTSKITIVDQRRGPQGTYCNQQQQQHSSFGYSNKHDLDFSPDGRFLISTGDDRRVRVWSTTNNCAQLHKWNMSREVRGLRNTSLSVSFSPCSNYIAVSLGTHVFLKDVKTSETIKSLVLPPFFSHENIETIQCASQGRGIFICRWDNGVFVIQVWYPYREEDDEDRVIILLRQPHQKDDPNTIAYTFSQDTTMVAIHNMMTNTGIVWSIDLDHHCLTHQSDILDITSLHFTPDHHYIVCNTGEGPKFWNIAEHAFTNNTLHIVENGQSKKRYHNLYVGCFSPTNRHVLIHESGDLYITSYFVK
mmetsp:Transcript_4413/g.5018  ORF Transcript_4413/g.5018 Transcript_4413/m.5018 type:complete len:647 (+) Transcript_4413:40-1980(+)